MKQKYSFLIQLKLKLINHLLVNRKGMLQKKDMPRNDPKAEHVSKKVQDGGKDTIMKEGEKSQSLFSFIK